MKKLAMSVLVVATLTTYGAGTAFADPPTIFAGVPCDSATVVDPQNQGVRTGVVGSHFVAVDMPGPLPTITNENPSHGHITCRYQTGSTYSSTGTVVASVTSTEQNTYVDLTTTVWFPDPAGDLYLCTIWAAGDATVAPWDDTVWYVDAATGEPVESTDAAAGSAACSLM